MGGHVRDKYGRIINMTSVAGVLGGTGQSSYGAAKEGLIALAKTAALESARLGITAKCVAIGISATDGYDSLVIAENGPGCVTRTQKQLTARIQQQLDMRSI